MNRRQLLASVAISTLLSGFRASTTDAVQTPPITPKRPLRIEQLGRVRIDDYAWLKAANWQEVWREPAKLDPAIRDYLQSENRYSSAILEADRPIEEMLFADMQRRIAPDPDLPGEIDGDWEYYTRFEPGAQHPRYMRRPSRGGEEQLLLDVEARARGRPFLAIINAAHSPDHRYFAWAEDDKGAEKFRILIRNLATGAILADPPGDAFGDFAFSPDSRWLFWTWRDADSRPARIYRRPVGGARDVLVFEETDPAFLTHVSRTASNGFIVIRSWNDVTSDVRIVPAATPEADPQVVEPRRTGVLYSIDHWRGRLVILTNADGAVDFKLMLADPVSPGRAGWSEMVPHRLGHFITEIRAFANNLIRVERVEGNPVLIVQSSADGHDSPIMFPEPAHTVTIEPGGYSRDVLTLSYASPRTPRIWYRCDLASGERTVVARQTLLGFDSSNYELLRLHAGASDGAQIPITLLRRRGVTGPVPLMLTGYGSYGYSYETGFSAPVISLVDQGWAWAVAHVRGGSEKGRNWFEQARTFHKKLSFSDFITCAEHLIGSGYTAPKKIAIHGFSAGGLLVGAANNMRPDLWGAVIGQAPFVDMLNTMSDAAHPLVPLTRPVWGDPLADPDAYDYIASYSPYENVREQAYPPVLATTAIGDDRVGYWEAAKWIARLREKSTSGNPMLLHLAGSGGHVGASGRFDELRLFAKIYAFAIGRIATAT